MIDRNRTIPTSPTPQFVEFQSLKLNDLRKMHSKLTPGKTVVWIELNPFPKDNLACRRFSSDLSLYVESFNIKLPYAMMDDREGAVIFADHGAGFDFTSNFPAYLGSVSCYRDGVLVTSVMAMPFTPANIVPRDQN